MRKILDSLLKSSLEWPIPDMRKNQHRWKKSLDDYLRGVLEEAAERLAWAWALDREDPKSYPVNTEVAFYEIRVEIEDYQSQTRPATAHKPLKFRRPPPPKRFADLVDDSTIRAVYENQNVGTYNDALKVAASGARRTFRKILNAVEVAYLVSQYGEQVAPNPRIHFLHRRLLDLVDLLQLTDLTHEGIAEFLDDVCPCSERHALDAIRKLRKRRAVSRATP